MSLERRIERILEKLTPEMNPEESIRVFRNLFSEAWGFAYADKTINPQEIEDSTVRNLTQLLKIIAKSKSLKGEKFYIFYAKSPKKGGDTVRYRQRLIRYLINITDSIDLEFANFLVVVDYDVSWKLLVPIYKKEVDSTKINIYTIDPMEKKFRTLVKNLAEVGRAISEKKELTASDIKELIDEYMQVKPLTEEFFLEYKRYYYKLKNWIKREYGEKLKEAYSGELPDDIFVERAAKTFAHTFFNRLMFVYFLQKKGWIVDIPILRKHSRKAAENVDVKNFIRWLHKQYEEHGGEFYRDYLRVLFIYAMNSERFGRWDTKEIDKLPSPAREVFIYGIPYFNGGLFNHVKIEDIDLDDIITSLPDDLVKDLIFEFFEEYNFTVTEETPYEVEVAVDPAMLGKIYESLIAEEEKALEEEERRVSGIFYTPRAEVDFMCRMAVYEYLTRNVKVDDSLLRDFVFTPLHEWERMSLPRELITALQEVKIVDPAAGSGAFLVGMFHLLTELYEKAGVKIDYERKLTIIGDNIYGVDIKEWAIRVAKLRLWLALIEDEEIIPNEPILPNLETKLAVGDSLAPPHFTIRINGKKKIIEIPLSKFRETLKLLWARSGASEAIVAYKNIIKKYYLSEKIDGKPVTLRDIENGKWMILKEFLEKALEEELKAKEKKEVKLLLDAVKKEDFSALERPPFIWELDFPDVMLEKRGFDIVIANPPYVRQEKIYPEYYDLAEFQLLPRKEQEKLKKEYKKKIIKHMETIIKEKFKSKIKLPARSDLYAYFFIQGVNLLNPKGALVFITSNSWLDVDYGTALQEFFLRFTELKAVIDYTTRSFEQADVNTVITILARKPMELFNTVDDSCTNFVLLKRNFDEIGRKIINRLLECYIDKVKGIEVFGGRVHPYEDTAIRVRSVRAVELAKMGGINVGPRQILKVKKEKSSLDWWMKEHEITEGEIPYYPLSGEYKGMKWGGILIRAPRIFYVILDKGKGKLVKLGEIAEVKRGFTTGANEFFYLEPIKNPIEWPVCPICGRVHEPGEGLVAVRNKAGWEGYIEEEFLRPVVKSPREIKKILIDVNNLGTRVFMCGLSKESLLQSQKLHALAYIEWGEKQKSKGHQGKQRSGIPLPQLESFRNREFWYKLTPIGPFEFFCNRFFNDRLFFAYPNEPVLADQTLYGGILKHTPYPWSREVQVALLNSTVESLIASFLGRVGLGEGVLQYAVYEMEELLVVNGKKLNLSKEQLEQLIRAFEQMTNREIKSIFEELGLPKPKRDLSNIDPEDVSLDKVMPDRRELDRIIFDALGLTEEEQLEVYKAVVELVKARLVKAKTFSNKKKKRG